MELESLVTVETPEVVDAQLINPNAAAAMVQSQTPRSGAVEIEADKAKAEALASEYRGATTKRNLQECRDYVKLFCKDPVFAEKAVTARPDHKDKIGPSIRLMEVIAAAYQNLKYGDEVLGYDRDKGTEVRIWCRDVQFNTEYTKVVFIPHERQKDNAVVKITMPNAIEDHVNAKTALQIRKALQKVIPSPLVKEFVALCQDVTAANIADLNKKKVTILTSFKLNFGVTELHIQRLCQKPVKDLTAKDVTRLWQIYLAVRDEGADPKEWFPDLTDEDMKQLAKPEAEKPPTGKQTAAAPKNQSAKSSKEEKPSGNTTASSSADGTAGSAKPDTACTTDGQTSQAAPVSSATQTESQKPADPKSESSSGSQPPSTSEATGDAQAATGSTSEPTNSPKSQPSAQPQAAPSVDIDSIWDQN